jgi:hypothetical protein
VVAVHAALGRSEERCGPGKSRWQLHLILIFDDESAKQSPGVGQAEASSYELCWAAMAESALSMTEVVPDIHRYVGAHYIEGVHGCTDIGVVVAPLAASGETVPPVAAITATWRRTRSAAGDGRRS